MALFVIFQFDDATKVHCFFQNSKNIQKELTDEK